MSGTFRSDVSEALRKTQRDTYAWLGALRYAVYSTDPDREKDDADDGKSRITKAADSWYERVNKSLEGAFASAEGALANEWQMQRDPRHRDEESEDRFASKFEDNIGRIAHEIRTVEAAIKGGVVLETRQMRDALSDVKDSLRALVQLYDENLHELTLRNSDSSLLEQRAWIMQREVSR